MTLNTTAQDLMADALKAAVGLLSLHSADPGAGGANETSAGRQAPSWGATSNGDFSLSGTVNFTGGAASGACTHVGLWNGAGDTFYGGFALTGDQTFNAAGDYNLNSLTINGSSP